VWPILNAIEEGVAVPVLHRRAGRTVWRHAHGTVLVRPIVSQEVFALTGAGADLWQMFSEPLTVDQIARRLAEAYNIPAEEIEQDIAQLIDELASRGVLDRLDPA
jgi:Coenzyme PQQ synthesis protein D (PqqD)